MDCRIQSPKELVSEGFSEVASDCLELQVQSLAICDLEVAAIWVTKILGILADQLSQLQRRFSDASSDLSYGNTNSWSNSEQLPKLAGNHTQEFKFLDKSRCPQNCPSTKFEFLDAQGGGGEKGVVLRNFLENVHNFPIVGLSLRGGGWYKSRCL